MPPFDFNDMITGGLGFILEANSGPNGPHQKVEVEEPVVAHPKEKKEEKK